MARRWQFPLILLALAGGAGWWFRGPAIEWSRARLSHFPMPGSPKPRPDPEAYAKLAAGLDTSRKALAVRHAAARTAEGRAAIELEARQLLEKSLPPMMRCWLGTRWDFNGTAAAPGQGKIACGYFVATVLKDAGFRVDRYQLAQQASGNILRSFLPKNSCTLSVGKPYESFADGLEQADPGIYIVGLDTHVAFLVVGDGGFRFIHSSGSRPWCVVDENRSQAGVLQRSRWRMTGNLTADREVLRTWLKAGKIVVREG